MEPEHRPQPDGEVFKIVLNTGKARNVLGWEPRVFLEEGLSRTVESVAGKPAEGEKLSIRYRYSRWDGTQEPFRASAEGTAG